MALLGISISGTLCSADIYSEDGRLLSRKRAAFPVERYQDVQAALPARIWEAFCTAVKGAVSETDQANLSALCITGGGDGLVALDRASVPLGPCVFRTASAMHCASSELPPDIFFEMTGQFATDLTGLDTLSWYNQKYRGFFGQLWRYVPVETWLQVKLGGQAIVDASLGSRALCLDIRDNTWSRQLLDPCGIREAHLPPIVQSASLAGRLSADAASELGLDSHVQLVVGGWDRACEALGAGVLEPAKSALYCMQSSFDLIPSFAAISLTALLLKNGISMTPHVQNEALLGVWQVREGGAMLRWFRDQIARQETAEARSRGYNVYERLLAEMPDYPTELLYRPPAQDRSTSVLEGLKSDTSRSELLRGLVEGITEEMTEGLERFEHVGIPVETLHTTGIGAYSDVLLQLTADISGCEILKMEQPNADTLGAALIAACGAGVYESLEEAVANAVRVAARYEPRPALHEVYVARRESRRGNRPRGEMLQEI